MGRLCCVVNAKVNPRRSVTPPWNFSSAGQRRPAWAAEGGGTRETRIDDMCHPKLTAPAQRPRPDCNHRFFLRFRVAPQGAVVAPATECRRPRERMRQAAPLVFQQAKALLIEMGASRRLGELIKGMGSKRTLLVTDSGVRGAGLLEESVESLLVAGVHVTVFDKTVPDPPESLVLECATFAREEGVDSVVGFGGGSSMDVAKLVSLLASPTSSQPLDEMFGVGNARGERLPLLQVPTTAGTGSEVTPISIITTGAVVASNPNQTLN